MSWLARSIANSLLIDDDNDFSDGEASSNAILNNNDIDNHKSQLVKRPQFDTSGNQTEEQEQESENQGRGVKEDLSEFTESITRQIWGVASFLAPPPPPPPRRHLLSTTTQIDPCESDRGRRVSSLSTDFACGEGASNSPEFLDGSQNSNSSRFDQIEDQSVFGVTEEVLAFAKNIAHHPETWLDFPLSEEEDNDDFEMSDTQWNHVNLVERLAPRLAALRIELCPIHMSESYFWKVYFVLLHPRLNKHDADLLSTPQIVAARAMWMKELQKRPKPEPDAFERNTFHTFDCSNALHEDFDPTSSDSPSGSMSERTPHAFEPATRYTTTKSETEKYPVVKSDNHIVDKTFIKEVGLSTTSADQIGGTSYKIPVHDFEDDEDDWINENAELEGYDGPDVLVGSDEDISFSDLEADDMPIRSKKI